MPLPTVANGTLSPAFHPPQSNITDLGDLIRYGNDLSGGIYIIGFTYVLWIVLFAAVTQKEGAYKGYLYATFIHFFLTATMVAAEWLDNRAIILPLIMLGVSGVMLWRYRE